MNRLLQGLAIAGVAALSACAAQPATSTVGTTPSAASTPSSEATPAAAPSEMTRTPSATTPTAKAVGSAKVDTLTFTVLSVGTRDLIKGRNGLAQKGHWLAIVVEVTNAGSDPVTVNGESFEVSARGGKTYQTDDPAMFQAAESDALIGEEITPGGSAQGLLLFSIPRSVTGLSLTVWKPRSSSAPGVIPLGS